MNLRGYWAAMTLWLRTFLDAYPGTFTGSATALCAFAVLLIIDPGAPLW